MGERTTFLGITWRATPRSPSYDSEAYATQHSLEALARDWQREQTRESDDSLLAAQT